MDQQYANQLLRQAESNEIWATLQPKRKADRLNKVAKQMRNEAMRIMDEVTGYEPNSDDQNLSDSELLDLLLGE